MNEIIQQKYPHICFRKNWELTEDIMFIIGQCEAIIRAITNMPITPAYKDSLLQISLTKGAQATTAIEGNSLTEEDIIKISKGENLPPSKEYQQIEIKNILDAFNSLIKEVKFDNHITLINPELIKNFHKIIGQNLGEYFNAVPGSFRNNDVIVGNYKPPEHIYVKELMDEFCEWLKTEFHFEKGQSFKDNILQALITHIYIAWIHPFSDGNGRTARLLEFFLLIRGGTPIIASHLLSNFYNETRNEYYLNISKSTKSNNLTSFISYAVTGLRDGLNNILEIIQKVQLETAWKYYIIELFDKQKFRRSDLRKRQRLLMLSFPLDKDLTVSEIRQMNAELAVKYSKLASNAISRDLEDLEELKLLIKINSHYKCNYNLLNLTN
jgi:Fic family protein